MLVDVIVHLAVRIRILLLLLEFLELVPCYLPGHHAESRAKQLPECAATRMRCDGPAAGGADTHRDQPALAVRSDGFLHSRRDVRAGFVVGGGETLLRGCVRIGVVGVGRVVAAVVGGVGLQLLLMWWGLVLSEGVAGGRGVGLVVRGGGWWRVWLLRVG